jgi:hypothetical protein
MMPYMQQPPYATEDPDRNDETRSRKKKKNKKEKKKKSKKSKKDSSGSSSSETESEASIEMVEPDVPMGAEMKRIEANAPQWGPQGAIPKRGPGLTPFVEPNYPTAGRQQNPQIRETARSAEAAISNDNPGRQANANAFGPQKHGTVQEIRGSQIFEGSSRRTEQAQPDRGRVPPLAKLADYIPSPVNPPRHYEGQDNQLDRPFRPLNSQGRPQTFFDFLRKSPKGVVRSFSLLNEIRRKIATMPESLDQMFKIAHQGTSEFYVHVSEERIVLFDQSWSHCLITEANKRNAPEFLSMMSPIHIMRDIRSPPNLEFDECRDMDPILLHFPQLHLEKNQKVPPPAHFDCECPDEQIGFFMNYFLSAICEKRGLIKGADFGTGLDVELHRNANVTRCYVNQTSRDERRYTLLTPQPFLCNIRWTPRVFHPTWHGRTLRLRDRYFLGCSDKRYRGELAVFYSAEPPHWGNGSHPILSEPKPGSELEAHALTCYGSESLPRVNFTGHPMAYSFHISFSNLENDLQAEEFEIKSKFDCESFLLTNRRSFLDGQGTISCTECAPVLDTSGRATVTRYQRLEFLDHYRGHHYSSCCFIGTAFLTGLNSRIYENFLLYIMALTCESRDTSSDMEQDPFDGSRVKPYLGASEACRIFRPAKSEKVLAPTFVPTFVPAKPEKPSSVDGTPLDAQSGSIMDYHPSASPSGATLFGTLNLESGPGVPEPSAQLPTPKKERETSRSRKNPN